MNDLEDLDPEMAKNLFWCLEKDVTDVGLTFSVYQDNLGTMTTIDLVPGGRDKEVTEDNKKQYVRLMAQW